MSSVLSLLPSLVVGAAVRYSGDMANASGKGAIIGVKPGDFYGKQIEVALEDGRSMLLSPMSFRPGLGCRFSLSGESVSDEAVAALKAGVAIAKAKAQADKVAAAAARVALREKLLAENPGLSVGSDPANASANIRKLLKAAFPGVKFKVNLQRYSGGESIRVLYDAKASGIPSKDVEAIVGRFQEGSFNGMEDIYEYSNSVWCDLFGGARYVFVNL